MYSKLYALLLALVVQQSLHAQIKVDTLKLYTKQQVDSIVRFKIDSVQLNTKQAIQIPPLRRIFKYNIALTGTLNSGNVNRALLAFRSEFSWAGRLIELDLRPRFAYGQQNKQLAEREPYIDALLNFFHKQKVYGFLATNMEASNLRGITLRWLGGAGIGWHIIKTNKVKLSLTNLLLYEGTDFITGTDILLWRNSTRLKGQYGLFNNRLTLKHWFYWQPSFTNENFRWNGIISVEFPIYKNVQFRINLEDVYESIVPKGRKNEDRTLSFGLNFGKK